MATSGEGSVWFQRTITLAPHPRGCHYITDDIIKGVPEITQIKIGTLHLFSECLPRHSVKATFSHLLSLEFYLIVSPPPSPHWRKHLPVVWSNTLLSESTAMNSPIPLPKLKFSFHQCGSYLFAKLRHHWRKIPGAWPDIIYINNPFDGYLESW